MITPAELCVRVLRRPPPAGKEPHPKPELWRCAEIVLNGNVVATGYALGRPADFESALQEQAVQGEAITRAWHELTPLVVIVRPREAKP